MTRYAETDAYENFLKAKVCSAPELGFELSPESLNPGLKPHCKAIVPWLLQGGRRALFASFGLHKCHGAGTPILMADGSIRPVETVREGDSLMGDDGSPRRVLSLARGRDQLYRVTLKNGDSFVCNEGHILSLKVSNKYREHSMGDVVNMRLCDFLVLPEYARRNCFKSYKVSVDFPTQPVPMDPYLYGAWLGDGHQRSLAWTINDRDLEIVDQVKAFQIARGLQLREESGRGCTTYHLTRAVRGRAEHVEEFYFVQSSADAEGKRIDQRYLLNDRATRLQLLAGLIDTDGNLKDGCLRIGTKWVGLRDDLLYLVRSLGLSVSHGTQIVNRVTYFTLTISGHTDMVPCLTRKKAPPRRQIKTPLVYGFDVESLGDGEYFGFEIDGNHLYLLGDFTVTHNTVIQLETVRLAAEHVGGRGLIVLPLGVRQEFRRDAVERLGWPEPPKFIRRIEEAGPTGVYLTNYETVRDGKLDPRLFQASSLDEASVLRGFGGTKTFREFMALFAGDDRRDRSQRVVSDGIRFRFVATATPSPNDYIELLAYSAYLGIMDVPAAKTRFFKRNSEKADQLTLLEHKEEEFWLWVSSWALFIQKPSDLGFSDDGYQLPQIDVRWHEVASDNRLAGTEKDGQGRLFANAAISIQDSAREKRNSLPDRIEKLMSLRAEDPAAHRVIWHDLEAERRAIEASVPGVVSVYGSQDLDEREASVRAFSDGEIAELAAKPVMLGSGCNLQRHCAWAVFLGIGHKFNDLIQAIHRLQRFGQTRPVRIDLIYTEAEREIRANLERKWRQHEQMVEKMTGIIREFGLAHADMASKLARAMGVKERIEAAGDHYRVVNNDCVMETRSMDADSVDLIVTSVPFATQYEYSPNYADFGHSDDDSHFWRQMDFLIPELHRVLRPGRIAAIHVKDRIIPGGINGYGFQTISSFSDDCRKAFERHGFACLARKTIVTDVVRENNQTYRLGWTEQCKDGSRMGAGVPEYLLVFRKAPTDTSNGYADVPVVKDKARYTRPRWQFDAHGFMRSSGNRLLKPEELEGLDQAAIFQMFKRHSLENVYDFRHDVKIAEAVDASGWLPSTFMLLQPQSWHPDVWADVVRMRSLNTMQGTKGKEQHLCLARGSLVLTRAGYRPIEQVAVGDEVLTHMGRWRRVTVARCTGVQPVVSLKAHGVPGLTLTPDHKLWTRAIRDTPWARAHSRKEARQVEPGWLRADQTLGSYLNQKLPPEQKKEISEPELWLLGRWLADGHQGVRGDFWISVGEEKLPEFEDRSGVHAGTRSKGTATQIRLRGLSEAMLAMLRMSGKGAGDKQVPVDVISLPQDQARTVLEGYLSGDGHLVPGRNRWMATSVSKALLFGLSMLVQRAYGAVGSIHAGRPAGTAVIEGREVNTRQEWVLSFDMPQDRRVEPFVLEDGAWKKVRSIYEAVDVETWCLRVDEDESFTAEGCIVKNCPLPFDIVDRCIEQYSMKGETVYDPFGGLMTVPYCAIKAGRFGIGCELSPTYFLDGAAYCASVSQEQSMPSLFDSLDAEEAA